jgi:membrane associated rhomboid family serine protease
MSNNKHNGKGNGHAPETDDNVIKMPTLKERDRLRRKQEKEWRKQYRQSQPHEPMINLPVVTKTLASIFLVIHVLTNLFLDAPGRYDLYEIFGFRPEVYFNEQYFSLLPAIAGPLCHMFLHGSWMHVVMNTVMLVAFGAGLEKWMGGKRLFVLFYLCALIAALLHLIITPDNVNVMVGASGGVSGLFAAILIMFKMKGIMGTGKYGILPLIALWIGISIMFGFTGGLDGSMIGWIAHIGGFLAGLILIKPVLGAKWLN